MDITEAKKMVVSAGNRLVEDGLIARTWGNVSCRISREQFVITPSGRAYETLSPAEIVVVNIADCSYEGSLQPSSEKGIHAEVYRRRGDINFVIHTHQPYASALSPLKMDINVAGSDARELLGDSVVSIPYGLSGSKRLRANVRETLSTSPGKAFLMVSHGALCLGRDCAEAFKVAAELEKVCHDFLIRRYMKLSGRNKIDPVEYSDYIINLASGKNNAERIVCFRQPCNSERTEKGFNLYRHASEEDPFGRDKNNILEVVVNAAGAPLSSYETPPAAHIHEAIYRSYKDIGAVVYTAAFDILTISRIGSTVYPLLDDFAQIIGVSVKTIKTNVALDPAGAAGEIVRKLKGRSAVLLKNNGAFCCGPTKSDALAAAMVLEKNCRALIASMLFGHGRPINYLECALMRKVYLGRYSRKALEDKGQGT